VLLVLLFLGWEPSIGWNRRFFVCEVRGCDYSGFINVPIPAYGRNKGLYPWQTHRKWGPAETLEIKIGMEVDVMCDWLRKGIARGKKIFMSDV
jgi:hypothetical protein